MTAIVAVGDVTVRQQNWCSDEVFHAVINFSNLSNYQLFL